MTNPFAFSVVEDIEDGRHYGPGGLFPVKLGDILSPDGSPRYRISAKPGYGSYSTVWLARDFVPGCVMGSQSEPFAKLSQTHRGHQDRSSIEIRNDRSREAAILKHLCTPLSDPPAVLQLLDSFTVTSANGIHQALVTEPVISLQHFRRLPGIKVNMRSLVRQALEGLAFIHERGISHGGESCVVSSVLEVTTTPRPLPEQYRYRNPRPRPLFRSRHLGFVRPPNNCPACTVRSSARCRVVSSISHRSRRPWGLLGARNAGLHRPRAAPTHSRSRLWCVYSPFLHSWDSPRPRHVGYFIEELPSP